MPLLHETSLTARSCSPVQGGKKMARSVKVFVGYQFTSTYYARAELDGAIAKACETVEGDLASRASVTIDYEPTDISPGKILLEELSALVSRADICLFEVSHANTNVFFELGMAYALGKPTILLLANQAKQDQTIPSDLRGVVYLMYKTPKNLWAKLSQEILGRVEEVLAKRDDAAYFLDYVWMRSNKHDTMIVGEDLVRVDKEADEKGVFYVHSGDALALIEAQVNYALLNSEMRALKVSSRAIKGVDLNKNLLIIGGPRSNEVTKRLLKELELPWQFELGGERSSDSKCLKHREKRGALEAEKNHDVQVDYCMFLCGPNPFYPAANFSLFAGLYSFGVVGGLRAVSPAYMVPHAQRNISTILKQGWEPGKIVQVVAPVPVIHEDPAIPVFTPEYVEVFDFGGN